MVSKVGRGSQAHLICSDCGLRLSHASGSAPKGGLNQLSTVLLLVLFGLTAAGLMTLNDLHNHSLMKEDEGMNLNEERAPNNSESKRWIVVPRAPTR